MAFTEKMTDEEFEKRLLEVVQREFGFSGLIRFLRTHRSGKGDYTLERQKWADGVTVEELEALYRK